VQLSLVKCQDHKQSRPGQGRAGQGRAGQGRAGQGRTGHARRGKAIAKQGRGKAARAGIRASTATTRHHVTSHIASMLTPYIKPLGLLTLRHDALNSEDSNHTIPDSKA